MFSTRTLISLGQFLALQSQGDLALLLEKCGFGTTRLRTGATASQTYNLLRASDSSHVSELLNEICRSERTLRAAVNPKYLYDERWTDLERCLLLDGYRIAGDYSHGYTVIVTDPTIAAVVPLDDDLSIELDRSSLEDRREILRLIENSSNDFRRQPPDFNGALTSARVALETLAKNIAATHHLTNPFQGDPTKFGAIVAYLRNEVSFLDKNEQAGITGIYSFVSSGAHAPVGFTEEEMVRLGRSMIAAMC